MTGIETNYFKKQNKINEKLKELFKVSLTKKNK